MSRPSTDLLLNNHTQTESTVSISPLTGEHEAGSLLSIEKLKSSADRARLTFVNETAIHYYTLALAGLCARPGNVDALMEYDLLSGREDCYGLLGLYAEQQADLDKMKRLARKMKDVPRQIQVVTSQVTLDIILGNYIHAQQASEAGLKLARQVGNRSLEADCLTSLGASFNSLSDFGNALTCHKEALRIHRELGNEIGEALSLRRMGDCLKDMGQSALAREYAEQAYTIYHALGRQQGQAGCLNILGIITTDQARARTYYEQSLLIFQTIGDHTWQANLNNNLGLVYWSLGLYGKARDYLEQAVQTVRDMQGRSSLASFLESLGRVYIELEKYDEAQQVLEEGCDLSRVIGDRLSETTYLTMLGRVALASGQVEKARNLIQKACDMQRSMGTTGYLVTSLAWLGATFHEMGDLETAHRYTAEAIEQLQLVGRASEYRTQDVWWLHYQVLKDELARKTLTIHPAAGVQAVELDEQAWKCLQNARDSMMAGIATLSDDGLRRNYLNKVKFNRDILFEWALFSARRKDPQINLKEDPAHEPGPGLSMESVRTHDRLTRLLDISLQMNATLNTDTLLDFVMDNIIELSGAERGFLVLVNEAGELDFKVERGMEHAEIQSVSLPQRYPVLEKVIQTKTPVLIEYVEPDESLPDIEKSLFGQRSALCLPLLRRSELTGMIYADNRSVSGKFSQSDVDLLSIFANQAATAIENARLFRERERRITELSILDEISRSLSSTLNLDELLDTVYQQVGRIFDVTNFYIATYQEGDTEWVAAFQMDQGQRQPVVRHELGLGLTGYILRNRQPILLHSSAESKVFKESNGIPPVGVLAKSWMGVPLTAADKVVGVMAIQSYESEFLFDDHALNLFSTISSQVAIAIRNTRLYEEKSRANKELESFSYSVSHDLRAPIRAINGFSRILLEEYSDQLDEEGKKHLRRVSEAGLRMGVLIDDILRLSRVTRSEIRRGMVDLSLLAQTVIGEYQNAARDRQVEVVITPDLKVNADYNLLRIVLENLLGNAWKFTQKHPCARIELGVTEKDNQTTYFVRDDGAGFDMAYVNKLFGAFQRLHDAAEFEGTGIGLVTVQRIIQRHGGTVWAEGALEKGATFYFTLPG
jgi:signal transduction histidine kinase/tetratricopeptide (TPR) repeat protein